MRLIRALTRRAPLNLKLARAHRIHTEPRVIDRLALVGVDDPHRQRASDQ